MAKGELYFNTYGGVDGPCDDARDEADMAKKKRWRKDGIMRKMPCHSLINETK